MLLHELPYKFGIGKEDPKICLTPYMVMSLSHSLPFQTATAGLFGYKYTDKEYIVNLRTFVFPTFVQKRVDT